LEPFFFSLFIEWRQAARVDARQSIIGGVK
jgi:hypothetical protein